MTTTPRVGFWLPIFGGWLRNVEDEGMPVDFDYALRVARRAEELGFSTTLIAELNLNDIKGPAEPVLEAWTTAAALASTTEKLEIIAAIRPGFRNPAIVAKMAANIDRISNGRFTLNVVSAWWAEEARQFSREHEQLAFRADACKDHHEVELEDDDRIDRRAADAGIASATHARMNDTSRWASRWR